MYYFALIYASRRNLVEVQVGHFEEKHFQEVWLLRHYTDEGINLNVVKLVEKPDHTQGMS